MNLNDVKSITINNSEVLAISSQSHTGYIWNKPFRLKFVESQDFQSAEITTITCYCKINDENVTVESPQHQGYVFDGWNPQIPLKITSDMELTATYSQEQQLD